MVNTGNIKANTYVVSGVFIKRSITEDIINVQNLVRFIKADTFHEVERIFINEVKNILPDHEKFTILILENKKGIKSAKLAYEQRKLANTCNSNHTLFSDKDDICEICGKPLNADF